MTEVGGGDIGAHCRGGDSLGIHVAETWRVRIALSLLVLAFLLLGGISLAAGERLPWNLPPSAALPLKVLGFAAVATSLVILSVWGAHAACAHVSARLSHWLEGVWPIIADMSVFAVVYLVVTSQQRRRSCSPSDPNGRTRGFHVSMESPPPSFNTGVSNAEGGAGAGGHHRSTGAAAAWGLVASLVFAPKLTTGGVRTGGSAGPREVETCTRASRDKGKKIVPTSP